MRRNDQFVQSVRMHQADVRESELSLKSCSLLLCVQVKVILGEDREATGILLSIDGDDGIVRMELDDQLKILNLRFLGRLEH